MWKFHYLPREFNTESFGSYLRSVFLPFLSWLPKYKGGYIKRDFTAGLVVSAILIPQVMAYALLIGLPPHLGLISALVASVVGALWGSSAHVSTGPTAVVSILIFTSLIPLAAVGTDSYIALAIGLAILVGLIQLILGFFRFGFIVRLIPHSVLLGFSSAAGLIIAFSQIPALFGFTIDQKSYAIQTILELITHASSAHLNTLLIGLGSVLLIFYIRYIRSKFPIALTLLIGSIILSYFLSFEALGIAVVGNVPSTLPSFAFPDLTLDQYFTLLGSAFVIALIGFTETFSIAKIISNDTKQKISANQELVGQGLSNIASGFFGGFAVAGSFSRSAVNHNAGARTSISSVAVFLVLLFSILFLTQYLYYLPKAVLAAIVIGAVFQLINVRRIREIFKVSRTDGMVAVVTFAAAFFFTLEDAVLIGVLLALTMFMQRVMWADVIEEGFHVTGGNTLRRIEEEHVETVEGLIIARIDMPYFYANADHVTSQIRNLYMEKRRTERVRMVVLDFKGVTYLDLTALEQLSEFFTELHATGVKTNFIYAKIYERQRLRNAEEMLGEIRIFYSTNELKRAYEDLISDQKKS